ncbi:Alpha-(1-_3)-arabinofuranosyltransferase [Corynebacterium atrinae]|uniref:alpha-(1->3)-arabinofuranosyltransferase domain-containing protein n=1 Tax=Corynebacterium atrinae TaxID=1336740 RepID=UPI0025B37928|nr:alpha-(1->3)-arabinofuranosyltransferase family protein [Corynebacterium atrinae]WJY64511.1 Alpha-(1->3)-arabinofuranosyltransferase [Corynebacterium atrinae]
MLRRPPVQHLIGWLFISLLVWAQSPGRTSADTKHDLAANPAGFLAGALHAWTDTFALGQLQNQAYGYLFPQGAFFLLTDVLPSWVAQRMWWTLVLGVGFSGFLLLVQRLRIGSPAFQVLAALLFALSPRSLSTLTSISSETWPVMLAPWVMVAVLGKLGWRAVAAATIPVALMGSVNATATLAACTPAGLLLLWRVLRRDTFAARTLFGWLVGCLLVSLWWIGPLLVLGRYSAPFTDYIESSFVTTRWLNLVEVLRGTTSWAPFVDTERLAGTVLVSSPVFVLATVAVAALGLWGLTRRDLPLRHLWIGMLFVGVGILGAAHGPLAVPWLSFLDGAGAPLRNLHKFDLLVRLPLLVGLAGLGSMLRLPAGMGTAHGGRRQVAGALVVLIAAASLAPAWSDRLLPRGAYEHVPSYWQEAANYLNSEAAGTRTLITPEASFARQTWGWTRDEPAQPLLEIPWAVRDAVPLVNPEAIRGLDGVMAVLNHDPAAGYHALRRLGIGAVLVRHDLVGTPTAIDAHALADATGGTLTTFGAEDQIEIVLFDPHADLMISDAAPVRVAGGGESLALLDALSGPGPRKLVDRDADVVTDTPLLTVRNYGTLHGATSAPLANRGEGSDVSNAVPDYPSVGPLTRVESRGGEVAASSSAADATSFGGADPRRSLTASVDQRLDTAWWPTPGAAQGQWLQLTPSEPVVNPLVTVTATDSATVVVNDLTVELTANEPTEVQLPGIVADVRVTLTSNQAVGLAEVAIAGHEISRLVTVPDTSPDVRQFLFQRLFVDTGVLIRSFTAPRPMSVRLEAPNRRPVTIDGVEYSRGDLIELPAGQHRVETRAQWISLTEEGFTPSPPWSMTGRALMADDSARLLITGRAANPGLRAHLGEQELVPMTIDAATQAFLVPAGTAGVVQFSFAGEAPYRWSLFGGALLGGLTLLAAIGILTRRGRWQADPTLAVTTGTGLGLLVLAAVSIGLTAGWPGWLAGAAALVIRRVTIFPTSIMATVPVLISGAWLARGPWPSADYAGDSLVVALLCAAALASLLPGSSTKT